MKKSLSLVMAALMFVVLGCSLDRFTKSSDEAPTPVTDSKSGSDTDKKPSDSPDSKSAEGLTMENYEKVETGMSYDEVEKIFGSKGTETRTSSVGNSEFKSYKWESGRSVRVFVNFKDDKMTNKSQAGLRTSSSSGADTADISMAKYEKIENDMSISEVEEVVGSKGSETSSSTIGTHSYKSFKWKGEKFSYITVRFKDDKVNGKSQYGLK